MKFTAPNFGREVGAAARPCRQALRDARMAYAMLGPLASRRMQYLSGNRTHRGRTQSF